MGDHADIDHSGLTGVGGALEVCSAYNSSALAVSTSGEGNVTMDTDGHDPGGYHDTGSNTSRFTIPTGKGGGFLLVVNMRLTADPGNGYFTARKNGGATIVAEAAITRDTNTGAYTITLAQFLELADADYLNFTALAQSACNISHQFPLPWISLIKLY